MVTSTVTCGAAAMRRASAVRVVRCCPTREWATSVVPSATTGVVCPGVTRLAAVRPGPQLRQPPVDAVPAANRGDLRVVASLATPSLARYRPRQHRPRHANAPVRAAARQLRPGTAGLKHEAAMTDGWPAEARCMQTTSTDTNDSARVTLPAPRRPVAPRLLPAPKFLYQQHQHQQHYILYFIK